MQETERTYCNCKACVRILYNEYRAFPLLVGNSLETML